MDRDRDRPDIVKFYQGITLNVKFFLVRKAIILELLSPKAIHEYLVHWVIKKP